MRVPRFKSRADTKACGLYYYAYGVAARESEQARSHTPTHKKADCAQLSLPAFPQHSFPSHSLAPRRKGRKELELLLIKAAPN